MNRMRMPLPEVMAIAFLIGSVVPDLAAQPEAPDLFVSVGDRHGVPAVILYAMARTESGRAYQGEHKPWPWTLNVAGKGRYYDTRDQACIALNEALGQTSLVDVGMAQLNVRWNPELFGLTGRFADPCAALDPAQNMDAAAAILRAHFDTTGDWLTAAGRYHRPAGGDAARRYTALVAARMDYPVIASVHRPAGRSRSPHPQPLKPAPVSWIEPVHMVWITPGG